MMMTYVMTGVCIMILSLFDGIDLKSMYLLFSIIGFAIFPYLYSVIVYASEIGGGEWKYYGICIIFTCNPLA